MENFQVQHQLKSPPQYCDWAPWIFTLGPKETHAHASRETIRQGFYCLDLRCKCIQQHRCLPCLSGCRTQNPIKITLMCKDYPPSVKSNTSNYLWVFFRCVVSNQHNYLQPYTFNCTLTPTTSCSIIVHHFLLGIIFCQCTIHGCTATTWMCNKQVLLYSTVYYTVVPTVLSAGVYRNIQEYYSPPI